MKKTISKVILWRIVATIIVLQYTVLGCIYFCLRTEIPYEDLFSETSNYIGQHTSNVVVEDPENIKILELSDFHNSVLFSFTNQITFYEVGKVIDKTQPDLIILNGDIVWSLMSTLVMRQIVSFMDSKQIPWAYSFGNHDVEFGASATRLISVLDGSKYCVSKRGYTNLNGLLNYFVTISDSMGNILHSVGILNNGSGEITQAQCEWFSWTTNGISDLAGREIANTVFIHIPLKEMAEKVALGEYNGNLGEPVSEVKEQNDFFERLINSNTLGVFNGHDHVNDFTIFKDGILMHSCRGSGYSAYTKWNTGRGATLVSVNSVYNSIMCQSIKF